MQLISIDDSWLKRIEILRENEISGGFQRKFRERRAKDIAHYMKNGHHLPPVYIGKIGDRYVCIDGQHRLEARKLKQFELFGVVRDIDLKTATDEFEAINTMGTKVPLFHRLKISTTPISKYIRACAERLNLDIRQVYAVIKGLTRWGPLNEYRDVFPEEIKIKTEIILDTWQNDKRWKSKSSVFARCGMLTVVGMICKHKKNPRKTLNKLLELNYHKPGFLYTHYGAGGTSLTQMRNYILRTLFNGMADE